MGLSLEKIERYAPELLSLAKTASVAVQAKQLHGQKAKVALALDFSGSMGPQYRNGSMQRLAEKVLALATQLDDDGAIDLFLFSSHAEYVGEVTLLNFRNVIDRITSSRYMGTTNYADLFKKVLAHYDLTPREQKTGFFGRKTGKLLPLQSPVNEPVYVVFLTDGEADSESEAIREITNASYSPVFWQFLSIGSASVGFLEELDNLDSRWIDNANYEAVGNVDTISDEKLFNILLNEYPSWLEEERRRGQIR